MIDDLSWRDKRIQIRSDLADCFTKRTGIDKKDFLKLFFSITAPYSIGDFNSQYLAGEKQLDEIFETLAARTGVNSEKINSHYDRAETFVQFGEHLLRSGAYQKGGK